MTKPAHLPPTSPGVPSPQAEKKIYPRKWMILLAISISLFLGSVDGSIVNVSLPTLVQELNTDFPTVQWVVLAYLLGLTVLMLSMGRLADIRGKQRIFAWGLVLFLIGSALCGLAPGIYWLIGFRFVQSVGASMMLALGVAIVTETWPDRERGKAIGITGGVISLGIVAGPAVGGVILQNLSWRWIFMVNVPIGAIALVMVLLYVPPLPPKTKGEPFDWPGAGILGLGLFSIALALTVGQKLGFTAPLILALFALAGLTVPIFIWQERRVAYPMIDMSLFNDPHFSLNLLNGVLSFVAIAAVVFLLPFYLTLVLKLDASHVGLLMAVSPVVLGLLSPLSGVLADRFGTRPISAVGLFFTMCGYLALTLLTTETSSVAFVFLLLPLGIGMATFQSPNNSAVMGTVPRHRLGVASGTLSMSRTLGQVIGISVLGAFFASRLTHHAGGLVDVSRADPGVIVLAMRDQFTLAAGLIGVGLVLFLGQWARERAQGTADTPKRWQELG